MYVIENIDHIHIFKTNIQTEDDVLSIKRSLDSHTEIEKWSVDLHDIDYVLRIVSCNLTKKEIMEFILLHGYECTELE